MNPEPILEPSQTQERAFFKRFKDFDWLHATFVQHSFAPHTHDGFVFSVIERGVEAFSYRRKIHHATKNNLMMINPDEVHTGFAPLESGWTYRCFYPSVTMLNRISLELGLKSSAFFSEAVVQDEVLAKQFIFTHQLFNSNASQLVLDSQLFDLMTAIIIRFGDTKSVTQKMPCEPKAIREAREFLEANLNINIGLAELAQVADLSEFTLLRAFKHIHGLPPHAYVIQNRLKRAKAALPFTSDIASLALEHGFSDQAHFTRAFKKTFGITPAVYRNG
jgi:AraC-like DNA-binding protein